MENIKCHDPPKPSRCRHSNKESDLSHYLEYIWFSLDGDLSCQECKEGMSTPPKKKQAIFGARFLWACKDCNEFFCGIDSDSGPVGHISCHAANKNHHPYTIPFAAWCYACNSFILGMTEEEEEEEENKEMKSAMDVKEEMTRKKQEKFEGLAPGNMAVYRVRSMRNFGNACFYNSVLQNLLSMDQLRDNFEKLDYDPDRPISNNLRSFFIFTDDTIGKSDHRCLFDSICSLKPKYKGYKQQDSHEFLIDLLNGLLSERTSCVSDIFGGILSIAVSCRCGHTSTTHDSFLDLSLPLPSNKCSTKRDEVVTRKVNVIPAREEDRGRDIGIATRSFAKVDDSDFSDLLTVPINNWLKKRRVLSSDKVDAKVDKEDPNDYADDEEEEDPEDCCGQHPCICNKDSGAGEGAELHESQQKTPIEEGEEEDPEDCCGQHPCICNKDSGAGEDAELHESQQKTPIKEEEEEEDPEDCCRQHPCICNKDSGADEDAELHESQQKTPIKEEEEEDPEDCCGQHPCICNTDSGEVTELLESQQKDPIKEQEDPEEEEEPENCCGQHPCICNKDSGEVPETLESKQKGQIKKENEDPEEEQQQEEEEEAEEILSAVLELERCLDLFTASEPLSDEYACDHCRDRVQHPNSGPGKGEWKSETSYFQGSGIKDEGINRVEATKTDLIFRAPPILTIHLKRFMQDAYRISKIDSHVNFQEMLDLTPYMDPSSVGDEKYLYRLIGVVEHMGINMTVGHYVAYVRGEQSQGRNVWFKANDDQIEEVSLQEVLERDAYILFFERTKY